MTASGIGELLKQRDRLKAERDRLRADALALAQRLAAASEALTRAAERQDAALADAYRRGQADMKEWALAEIEQCVLAVDAEERVRGLGVEGR